MDNRALAYAWQDDLIREYQVADAERYLVAAWTGLGKTRAGAKICATLAQIKPGLSIIVLVPNDDIAKGWRKALHGEGLHIRRIGKDQNDRTVAGTTCACGAPATVLVMTYQFCAAHPHLLLREVRKPHALQLDESHHLRRGSLDREGWILPLRMASQVMASAREEGIFSRVVSYSATPLRTDEEPVPWIHTKDAASDELDPLPDRWIYKRTYGQALTQRGPRPVTPVVFERFAGDVEWGVEDEDGATTVTHQKRISDEHPKYIERKVRRYAVDGRGGWLRNVLEAASSKREELAAEHPSAGALAIGRNTNQAVAMADTLVRQGQGPVHVYMNDYMTDDHQLGNGWTDETTGKRPGHRPELSDTLIDQFRKGNGPWIVSVKKMAEGIDVDRLRVLVYATTVATWLAFVQAVGRVLRTSWSLPAWIDQCAWAFILDDKTMSGYAARIEDEQIEASLDDDDDDNDDDGDPRKKKTGTHGTPAPGRERFIGSTSEYSGATAAGQHLDAQLMTLANKAGLSGTELPALHKIWDAGLLWSQTAPAEAETITPEDPEVEFDTARKDKNQAVHRWASARRRAGEFTGPTMMGDSYAACHNELGDLFGVWKDSANVTTEQYRKAEQWANEQCRALRDRQT
jgi:superfamily II DNA or RNA helicase